MDEVTGLFPCGNGIQEKDWRDCKHPDEQKEEVSCPAFGFLCSLLEHRGNLEGEGDNIADEEIIPVDEEKVLENEELEEEQKIEEEPEEEEAEESAEEEQDEESGGSDDEGSEDSGGSEDEGSEDSGGSDGETSE